MNNCQKLKRKQKQKQKPKGLSVGGRIKKLWSILTMVYYSAEMHKSIHTRNNLDKSQKHFAEAKKPISRVQIINDSIYMTFSKSHNNMYRKQLGGC